MLTATGVLRHILAERTKNGSEPSTAGVALGKYSDRQSPQTEVNAPGSEITPAPQKEADSKGQTNLARAKQTAENDAASREREDMEEDTGEKEDAEETDENRDRRRREQGSFCAVEEAGNYYAEAVVAADGGDEMGRDSERWPVASWPSGSSSAASSTLGSSDRPKKSRPSTSSDSRSPPSILSTSSRLTGTSSVKHSPGAEPEAVPARHPETQQESELPSCSASCDVCRSGAILALVPYGDRVSEHSDLSTVRFINGPSSPTQSAARNEASAQVLTITIRSSERVAECKTVQHFQMASLIFVSDEAGLAVSA